MHALTTWPAPVNVTERPGVIHAAQIYDAINVGMIQRVYFNTARPQIQS